MLRGLKGKPLVTKLAAVAVYGVFPGAMLASLIYSPPDYCLPKKPADSGSEEDFNVDTLPKKPADSGSEEGLPLGTLAAVATFGVLPAAIIAARSYWPPDYNLPKKPADSGSEEVAIRSE